MNDILKTYMERFRENRHILRRYTAFVLALAMITTLFVNWQLHGVGISMTAQYQCGEEEHTHTADCYTKVLTCGYNEGELENAAEVAAAEADQPSAEEDIMPLSLEPQIEFVPHEHTDDCYTEVQTLTCMEEEHVHGDDCFDPEDGSLICDKFEHTHDESCYTTEYELTCGLQDGELVEQVVEPTQSAELAAMAVAEPVALAPMVDTVEPIYHHHTDACYEEVLTCPLPEHQHTVACLSDTSADLETPEEWQAANAEAVMTGNWDEDLLSVAKTQLGYEQSEKNFEIDPADGVTLRYYSRYGQSYGNPYGEWDVMFLSYCLKYAGIPQSAIPQEASVLSLRSSMSDMDWLLDGEDGSAANVGDIVIYNKYVTRTVAVDSSADGAADDLDDQFSMDTDFENGAELETSGASALDTAPAAEDTPAADSVITPDLPDTANPEQPAAKPVDSTGTSASGADTLIPSVVSPAAEPQTTTVTDAQPVETVGIVSEADDDTLTVISGDVDGKVAEVTISSAEVLAVVDVAYAQYADEMLSSAVDGALKAPSMLTMAGESPDTLTSVQYVDFFNETKKNHKGGITNLTFKVDNKEQKDNITLEFGKAVNAQFDYHVDAGVLSKTNNTLTYKLPTGLEPPEDKTVDIFDNHKPANKIGTQTFYKNGTTTLTFDTDLPYFDLTKGFDGSFYYDWEYTKASTSGNRIEFPGGTTVTLEKPQDIDITKSTPSIADGTITEDPDGKTRIHYNVVVSSTYGWEKPIWIQDVLQASGDLLTDKTSYDTATFKLVKIGKETKIDSLPNFDTTKFTARRFDSTKNFKGFEYTNLPALDAGEKYVLSYDVLTAYTGEAELDNTVRTKGKSAKCAVTLDSKVEKLGDYNDRTGLIDWTITVNNPFKADLKGYTVTDTLDNGATIKGDIKLFVTKKNDGGLDNSLKETISSAKGEHGFTYTFQKGDNAQRYKFTYSSTVPDTAASVKNTVKYGKGDSQFNADEVVPIPGQEFKPKKTASGTLTPKKDDPNTLIAPWTITVDMPHGHTVYTIKDHFYTLISSVPQRGNAPAMQKSIEDSLTLTYLDGTETKTLRYSDLVNNHISLNIKYYSSVSYTSEVPSSDNTHEVQSFIVTLDTTNCPLNLKELSFSYSTTVDVSKLNVGDKVTIYNYINDKDNTFYDSASYIYQKPRTEVNMTKNWRINPWATGSSEYYDYYDSFYNYYGETELDYDKNKDVRQKQIEYQVTLDLSALNELPETITLTDTLPKGVTYVSKGKAQSASIVFAKKMYDPPRYNDLPSKTGGQPISLAQYFREDGRLKVTNATEDEGQTLTFNITDKLDQIDFAQLKREGYTELVLRYRVKMTDDRWQNLKFNHNIYTNNVHWEEEDKDAWVSIPMKREVSPIYKVGEQVEGRRQVKYTVTINPAAANLNAAGTTITLSDVLHVKSPDVHATLDLSSVKLTNTDTGEEVPKADYGFIPPKLEYQSGEPYYTTVFTLPDQTPLKLEYVYETDATAEVDLKNTATLAGYTGDDANVTQQKVEGGSTAYQKSVTIHKVDKRNNLYGLAGAAFSLEYFDRSSNSWKASNDSKTSYDVDGSGNLTFYFSSTTGTADLKQNTLYRIIEVKVPTGYSAETDATYGGNKRYYFIYQGTDFNQQDAYYSAVGNNGEGAPENAVPPKSEVNFYTSGQSNDLFVPNTANSLTISKNWKDKDGNFLRADQVKMDTVDVQLYYYPTGGDQSSAKPYKVIQLTKDGGWTATVDIDADLREGYLFFIKELNVNESRFTVAYNQPKGVQVGETLTFTNTDTGFSDYELPSTGGTGTLPYTAVGGTMMLTALAYSFIHRKRRHEGRADD